METIWDILNLCCEENYLGESPAHMLVILMLRWLVFILEMKQPFDKSDSLQRNYKLSQICPSLSCFLCFATFLSLLRFGGGNPRLSGIGDWDKFYHGPHGTLLSFSGLDEEEGAAGRFLIRFFKWLRDPAASREEEICCTGLVSKLNAKWRFHYLLTICRRNAKDS